MMPCTLYPNYWLLTTGFFDCRCGMWDVGCEISDVEYFLLLTAHCLPFTVYDLNDFKDLKYSMAVISWKCVAIRSEVEQQAWP